MKRLVLLAVAVFAVSVFLAPDVAAQTAQARGKVLDEEGNPLQDVEVEMVFKGEGPKKTFKQKTGKNGGFIRVGMPSGPYDINFFKEGYLRYGVQLFISLGGLIEVPDVTLKKAPANVVVLPPGMSKEEIEAQQKAFEEAAQLGKTYQEAMEAIKAQQWDAAEILLKQVLEKKPDEPLVHFNLAFTARQKKEYDIAEAEYKKVTELEPQKSDAFIALATLYEESGRGAEAVEFLKANAAAFEQDSNFQTALGATAMNHGRYAEAEVAFKKAVALDPTNADVYYYLASTALSQGKTQEAIGDLQKCIELAAPDSPNAQIAKELLAAIKK
jgi:predicted Zn-dependent protease